MVGIFLTVGIIFLLIGFFYQIGFRILYKKIKKYKDDFYKLTNEINILTLNIIHCDVSNSVRNMVINQTNVMKSDVDGVNFNLKTFKILRYHLNTLTKIKNNLENDITKINETASFILNKEQYISDLNNSFSVSKRRLNTLCKKFDKDIIYKHLKNYTTDKKYYKENFINIIETYFDRANKSLCKLNISDALYNIEKINDLTNVYYFEINSVNELTETLYNSLDNYRMYDDEVKPSRGSLYNKVLTKFQRLKYKNDDVISIWNNIIKNLDIYGIIPEKDYISKSNRLLYIISELRKLDLLLDVELDVQQEIEAEYELLVTSY